MNIAQRFTLLVKGSFNALLDNLEDPERSLNQLVLDMEEELEAAKRAAARAMANEDRLRSKIAFHEKDGREWQEAAERFMRKGDESQAREALEHVERAERQRDRLKKQLEDQSTETAEVRESVARMNERIGQARARLQLLQAQLRQKEARQAINRVMHGVRKSNLYGEFDRISERVEEQTSAERAYLKLDEELAGDDLRRRVEASAVDEAVDIRLEKLRKSVDGDTDLETS
jgi:phage shock protein A